MIEKIKQMIADYENNAIASADDIEFHNEYNAVIDALRELLIYVAFTADREKGKEIAFKKAIKKIIAYMWEDEKKDYDSCESKEEHIFDSLKIVADYLGMEDGKDNDIAQAQI